MAEESQLYEVIVVGAGPAGLTAAVYLGRYRRRCLVLGDEHSRARWIPTSHNIPGFNAGIGGDELLAALKAQALEFGATVSASHVSALNATSDAFSVTCSNGRVFQSRYVLLATGIVDHLPQIDGAERALARGVLRVCPICDAFEAIDQRVAVLGQGEGAEREALFLRHYTNQVTLLDLKPTAPFKTLDSRGFERIPTRLRELTLSEHGLTLSSDSEHRTFDVAYLALGCSPQHDLARSLGARCDDHGALTVSAHQETSVPRLYAAGDVVRGLNQVVIAAAESAVAATDIHNRLRTLSA